jgi:hypothetical protein
MCWGMRKVRDGDKDKTSLSPDTTQCYYSTLLTAKIMNNSTVSNLYCNMYVSLAYLYFCHIYNDSSKAESTSLLMSVRPFVCMYFNNMNTAQQICMKFDIEKCYYKSTNTFLFWL